MKLNKILSFLLVLIILMSVFFLNMTFAGKIPEMTLMLIRTLSVIFFLAAWIWFQKKNMVHAKNLSFSVMAVNLSFFIVSFFTPDFWNLDMEIARGIALAKLSDGLVISLVLIISFATAGYKMKNLYLARGRLGLGLLIGLVSFLLMGYMAINNAEQPITKDFLGKYWPWILLFVLPNAFMEELLFRGIFLKQLSQQFRPAWAIVLTALVFSAAHLQVTYTADVLFFCGIVLILGLIWALLMHYTRSMIASVLFHAGADLVIIMPIYASFGING